MQFEIAAEETEKKTVYAADDRTAMKDELVKLEAAFAYAIKNSSPEVAAEVQRRIGQRLRELQMAVTNVERMGSED